MLPVPIDDHRPAVERGGGDGVVRRIGLLPTPWRGGLIGAVAIGAIGAVAGLVIGLRVHVATAVFSLFELGLPGALVGFVAGLMVDLVVGRHRR